MRLRMLASALLLVLATLTAVGVLGYVPSSNYTYDEVLGAEALIELGMRSTNVVPANESSVDVVYKFGHNLAIGTSAYEPVWSEGGDYPGWLDAAVTVSIASTDAGDTAAGDGARTVTVSGLDDDLLEIKTTATMNGTTPVVLPIDFRRTFRLRTATFGANGGNDGIIRVGVGTFTAGVPATVYATMEAPDSASYVGESNTTLMAFWTCPADATCLVVAGNVGCTGDCSFKVAIRNLGGGWRHVVIGSALSGEASPFGPGYKCLMPGGTDIECQAKSSSGGSVEADCTLGIRVYRNIPGA